MFSCGQLPPLPPVLGSHTKEKLSGLTWSHISMTLLSHTPAMETSVSLCLIFLRKHWKKLSKLNRFCGLKYTMEILYVKIAAVGRNDDDEECSTADFRIWEFFPYQLTYDTHLPIKRTFRHDFIYLVAFLVFRLQVYWYCILKILPECF